MASEAFIGGAAFLFDAVMFADAVPNLTRFAGATSLALKESSVEISAAKYGEGAGSLGGLSREGILDGLTGYTAQGNRVAKGLRNGDLSLNVLGDNMFEIAWKLRGDGGATPQAFAYVEKLYLRSSGTLGEVVHEGTHGLDYLYSPFRQSVWQSETRAYFFERQFQKASGGAVDFPNIGDMFKHIRLNY